MTAISFRRLSLVLAGVFCLIAILSSRVVHGATKSRTLWSLEPVVRPDVPTGVTESNNPIDAFFAQKYKEKGLKPAGTADKLTLLRRIYFDLIGLPPTIAEQQAFLRDRTPDAYEKVVDQLLANDQYGVRWARHWLDVLRYADLDGLDGSVMPAAPGIYLWRDWIISALNHDMSYDDFVRAQILGNRAKQHTAMTATGQRVKAESNPEDQFALGFLARAAVTRENADQDLSLGAVETVSSAFMGMTVACAKCHDHKFDPIKQKDFYAMKALFDPLVPKKITMATPAEIFANGELVAEYNRKKAPLEDAIEKLVAPYRTKLYDERVAMLTPDVQAIIHKREKERTPQEQKIADDYFPVLRIDPSKIKEAMPPEQRTNYQALLKQESALVVPSELPSYWTVEEDKTLLEQKTYILTSGDPKRPEKDKPVEPGFPFMPTGTDFREGRREAFVDWLTAPQNPLFARVAVNRIWQWHFGEGLQRVPSDFGLLGGKPSNPKLLDYLALEFVAHQYSMKWLTRLIVTSNTYKMASKPDAAIVAADEKIDPNNTYLWRFRLQRLDAEPIWDSILYDSGDLDLAVGGKSFELETPQKTKTEPRKKSELFDANANRRGIYMVRGYLPNKDVMPNFLTAFDADDGRVPCPMRGQTVTAPQALFMMNNELIAKESGKLAHRVLKQSAGNIPVAVNLAYRTTLGRAPSPPETREALAYIENNPRRLDGFSWMLFNLDEFVYVR
ncbi:MAG: DUF1549 and DUF1553 domain-containing protein [Acidobacteriota bacterium]|nr:DUF1549 and DUF1553 domain-containing protein [Acidobacteriota bacterium]MDQ2844503.1 DUF1549 and DUF1553 domain-containing protein [Acidobacteriota bacterium]